MNTTAVSSTRRAAGFTLIELMIAVVIAAILLAISIPTYKDQIRKSRRTEAKTALLDLAGREERLYSITNSYSGAATDLGYASGSSFPLSVGDGYYQVAVAPATPTTTFTFTATPLTADQAGDTACAQFTIDNLNVRGAKDSSNSDTTATCWR